MGLSPMIVMIMSRFFIIYSGLIVICSLAGVYCITDCDILGEATQQAVAADLSDIVSNTLNCSTTRAIYSMDVAAPLVGQFEAEIICISNDTGEIHKYRDPNTRGNTRMGAVNFTSLHPAPTNGSLLEGSKCQLYGCVLSSDDTVYYRIEGETCYVPVPYIPTLTSAERLSGRTARVAWTPLTPDKVKRILVVLEIDYRVKQGEDSSCSLFEPGSMDSRVVHIEGNLFEQTTANITGLIPNLAYCVAIQVSTRAGDSRFSNFIGLPPPRGVPFQIRYYLSDDSHYNCSHYVKENPMGKISTVEGAIGVQVARVCNCEYSKAFITNGQLFCISVSKKQIIYQGQLLPTNGKTVKEIQSIVQEWVLTKPFITSLNKQIDPYCSVMIQNIGDISCEPTSSTQVPTAANPDSIDIVAYSIWGLPVLLSVIVGIIIVAEICSVVIMKRKLKISKPRDCTRSEDTVQDSVFNNPPCDSAVVSSLKDNDEAGKV